eukprot:CCRYP_009585-RB/>CCRYP_009585-RB protein AED:0.03 eAED:0.03 QI:98/1/1/1/0.5/0.33/3/1490/429
MKHNNHKNYKPRPPPFLASTAPWSLLTIPILLLALVATAAVAVAADNDKPPKRKLALLTASLPWTFGPYQSQMHQLSLLLHAADYDIHWISLHDTVPLGTYPTYDALRPHLGDMIRPPPGFPLNHITFLGRPPDQGKLTAGRLNSLQSEYRFDALLILLDLSHVVPDEPFQMPVVAWVPLHSETVSYSSVDYWVLRQFHGVASLAPSSAMAIRNAVQQEIRLDMEEDDDDGSSTPAAVREMVGTAHVEFIPHIIDGGYISALADAGLELLRDHSAAEMDSKLTHLPMVHRGQERTLEAGHPLSLFGEVRKEDFVVLIQGGNYDVEDRKGWDTSIQAFARFYHSLHDKSRVHLLIHAIESYISSMDRFSDIDPPASVMPRGLNLRLALHEREFPVMPIPLILPSMRRKSLRHIRNGPMFACMRPRSRALE